jgi:hypothetical protein
MQRDFPQQAVDYPFDPLHLSPDNSWLPLQAINK